VKCQELVELVTEYFEGQLSDHDRAQLEAHLADCDDCTHYVAQMRETIELVSTQTADSVDAATVDHLLATFRSLTIGG
jgi:anti-sigma factor RsiW